MKTAPEECHEIAYGRQRVAFLIKRRERKTMSITVMPDQRVEIAAPLEASVESIKAIVAKRLGWIVRQQTWFARFAPRTPERRYLGGESHLYLGRHFRLKIKKGEKNAVRIAHGYMEVEAKNDCSPDSVKKIIEAWYRKQAMRIFMDIMDGQLAEFEIKKRPTLRIRRMRTRWGSLSKGGILTLNLALIRASKRCIEYVVCHELCHIRIPNHSEAFFELLAARMPDWKKRKLELEESLK
jgi:predicted metal-dependent hydrolase